MNKKFADKNDVEFPPAKPSEARIDVPGKKPYGLSINMGGDDVSVVAIVYKKN